MGDVGRDNLTCLCLIAVYKRLKLQLVVLQALAAIEMLKKKA